MIKTAKRLFNKLVKFVKHLLGYEEEEAPRRRVVTQEEDVKMESVLRIAKMLFHEKWYKNPPSSVSLSDFQLVKTLGEGKFGRVMLIRKRETDPPEYFALKIMNKRTILMRCSVACVLYEKRILQSVKHPFVVNYKYHFKDNANLYLVLEYIAGGDLFTHIRRAVRFGEFQTKFYAAQLVLALEYLHYVGVVHRDLKPENLMLDEFGYIKVTDFGFSKYIGDGTTSTKCGTRVYMAPEILTFKKVHYSYSVDWWPLGVLIYEMSVGRVPFEAANNLELLYKIKKHSVRYPSYLKPNTKSVIRGLLAPKLEHRLVNPADIKMHAYFDNINFMELMERKIEAPYLPTIRSIMDTSNFDHFKEEKIEDWQNDVYEEEFKDF